jgi:peptide/nickel transport system substrate-binding protein
MNIRKTLLFVFFLSFLLSACAPSQPPPPEPNSPTIENPPPTGTPEVDPLPTHENSLWVGWTNGPDNPNPFIAQWAQSFTIFDMVYSTMFRLQPDGTYSSDLVESSEVSTDGKIWTFKIRSDVKFHDGEALTAQDVAFSLNLHGFFGEIQATDLTTVQISLTNPIPNMEGHLLFHYILPQHIWARYENSLTSFDNLEMIGSGPFKMVTYQQDSFVHLTTVTNYYQYMPNITDVIYMVYEDENALVEAIRSGDVDMIQTLPFVQAESLAEEPNVEVVTGLPLNPTFEEIIFNQIDPKDCPREYGGICSGHPALRDRDVRLALAHATNKSQFIDQILLGSGDPGISIIPTGLDHYFNTSIQDYVYDPVMANQILDEAGYLDTDGDGIREMPDDESDQALRPLRFRFYYVGPSEFYTQLTEILSKQWNEIGVVLDIQELTSETILTACCPSFDYDIIVWTWDVYPEPGLVLDIMDTKEIPTSWNETGYSNPNYDILNAVQHSEANIEKRNELLWEMQRITHEDVVMIVLFYAQSVQAYRSDRFTGWITDTPHLALEDFSTIIQIEPIK